MFGGMNPAKMQGMMKKMGISQTELNVNRVIFEMEGKNLIIEDPSVIKIMMQGQETYQVVGEAQEQETTPYTEEDIKMVTEKTGRSEEEAKNALEQSEGDIAEAIISLTNTSE
jgi:nascent polypeptide-associated complex subunit alpha